MVIEKEMSTEVSMEEMPDAAETLKKSSATMSLHHSSSDNPLLSVSESNKGTNCELTKATSNAFSKLGNGKSEKVKNKLADRLRRKQEKQAAMQGKPLSGKWWKDAEVKKFSSLKNSDLKHKNNLKRMQSLRAERKVILERKQKTVEEKKARREHVAERRKVNQIRTLENQKKAERVQIIKDPRKIKKMKRKQLRQIETRDINSLASKNIQN